MASIPLFFGSKRSTNGSLLKYNAFVQTKFITDEIFNHIIKLENYNKLKNKPYLNFIDIFLKKKIFDDVHYIVSQIILIEHDSLFNIAHIDISNLNIDFVQNL